MKKLILLTMLLMCGTAIAIGPTVSVDTQQVASIDYGNSITVELGYFLGIDNYGPGLEPFVGVEWYPQWDDEGELQPPSVALAGARYFFSDVLDANSPIPLLPNLLLPILNEEILIRPFVEARFSMNFIDKDAGLMGLGSGFLIKTSPDSPVSLKFKIRYDDTFIKLAEVDDNRINYYMGLYYQF